MRKYTCEETIIEPKMKGGHFKTLREALLGGRMKD